MGMLLLLGGKSIKEIKKCGRVIRLFRGSKTNAAIAEQL